MKKSAIIVRNVSLPDTEDINAIIEMVKDFITEVDNNASPEIRVLQKAIINKEFVSAEQIRNMAVRDYIYKIVKEKTGNYFILHLDHEYEYVFNKLNTLENNRHFHLFYLGGSHGGGLEGRVDDEISGLSKKDILNLIKELQNKRVSFGAEVFGSCYSGAFTNYFRKLLINEGAMLADSIECGDSCFTQVSRWINDVEDSNFFNNNELIKTERKVSDLRASFNEFIRCANADELDEKYLLIAYAVHHPSCVDDKLKIKNELGSNQKLKETIQDFRTDLLDSQLSECAEAILKLGTDVEYTQIKNILLGFPMINDYVDNFFNHSVCTDELSVFLKKLNEYFDEYYTEHTPGDEVNISGELFDRMNIKFNSIEEQNSLKLMRFFCCDNALAETFSEIKEFFGTKGELGEYLKNYQPKCPGGPRIELCENKESIYNKIGLLMRSWSQEELTSKVISTISASHLMGFNESTGKPANAHEDAYNRVNKVIEIIRSDNNIAVEVANDVGKFNQISVREYFNHLFSNAMQASKKQIEISDVVEPIIKSVSSRYAGKSEGTISKNTLFFEKATMENTLINTENNKLNPAIKSK